MNKEFLEEKEKLLKCSENNTKEHWKSYYKDVPVECIYEDLVIDINEIKRLTEENEKLNHYKLLYQKVKDRNDKALEYNEQIIKDTKGFYRPTEDTIYSGDCLIDIATQNINILKGNNEE